MPAMPKEPRAPTKRAMYRVQKSYVQRLTHWCGGEYPDAAGRAMLRPVRAFIPFEIAPQPDDRTCGATCLHAIYRYYGDEIDLGTLVGEVPQLENGGTLGVLLANHALHRGYRAEIHTYNLQMFDPTWFEPGVDLAAKIKRQAELKPAERIQGASEGYLEFLELGGRIAYQELSAELLYGYLQRGLPILTGLSATYLYQSAREDPTTDRADDVGGEPVGHFVVLCGYEAASRTVAIADPLSSNPMADDQLYTVSYERLIGAILLGIVTYDANLLVIHPRKREL